MRSEGKKILVPVDGSAQSLKTVHYVAQIMPPLTTKIVLFHVLSKIPEHFRDLGIVSSTMSREVVYAMDIMDKEQRAKIEEFMRRARGVLYDAGFPESNVSVEIREMEKGFARDIAAESRHRYNAIAIGRKGINPLQEMVLGSIASKIVVNYCRIPIWLVGANPGNGKVLVAMDPSDSAITAVDHVAGILNGTTEEIRLIHAVRGIKSVTEGYQNIFIGDYLDKLNREAAAKITPVFEEAIDHMTAMGISSERISTTVVTGVASRAGAILKEAQEGDFGTIVLGRRGVTRVQNYDMGRVTYKLVQMVADRAVWVVGC